MQNVNTFTRHTFNREGFTFYFTENGKETFLKLDPYATCNLLKYAGFIEGFDMDQYHEPVILFTAEMDIYPEGYGFDRWGLFVTHFRIGPYEARQLLEAREQYFCFRNTEKVIKYLLAPLELETA